MRSRVQRIGLASAVLVIAAAVLAQQAGESKDVKHVKAKDAKFTEVVPGVSKCLLWGDDQTGPYGAFTRFEPGHKNALHTHSSEIRVVVLEGAYIMGTDAGEKRVEAQEFVVVPAGMAHTSAGDASKGCLFYEESPGKFDLKMVEKK